jgi:ubiquinone/menaquinone biosynthesis C-methylase UbiE
MKPDKYQETFETWNKIASLYQDKFMKLDLYNDSYDFICHSISKPDAKIFEVGCGPGNITHYLLSQRPDFQILGIDISSNMIELAKKNNPTAKFEVMDIRNMNLIHSKFDGIIAGFCLPYLSELEAQEFIQNSYEILNPDGLIYLSFVEGDSSQSGFKSSGNGRVYFYYHSLDSLTAELEKWKFQEIKIWKVDYRKSEEQYETHTLLTAKK